MLHSCIRTVVDAGEEVDEVGKDAAHRAHWSQRIFIAVDESWRE